MPMKVLKKRLLCLMTFWVRNQWEYFRRPGKNKLIQLSKRPIKDVKVAYPEMTIKTIDLLSGRVGKILGVNVSRFTVYFDYPNQRMALQPNRK